MLTNESKVKANQESKVNVDFYDRGNIKLYPANRVYIDSTFKLNRLTIKDFVIK
jgi:hypothetical protein